MGELKKLEIIGYKDKGFASKTGNSFSVMVNPSEYDESKAIFYSTDKAIDGGNAPVYQGYKDEKVCIDFMLDSTGVLADWTNPGSFLSKPPLSVTVKGLVDTVYTYVGGTHEPPYLNISWGSINFNGRLENMTVKYVLFTSDGEPLRAKVKLEILRYVDEETQKRMKNKSSPDLSHQVMVKAGDTLPALCMQIYKSAAYCVEVARVNGLNGFRNIEPGTLLLFPPLTNE